MTIEEASERYKIPIKILREYESWGLCSEVKKVMGAWQYDQTDIERLSHIMTLHDVGFTNDEVEQYMRLALSDEETSEERMQMLRRKRNGTLDEIHFKATPHKDHFLDFAHVLLASFPSYCTIRPSKATALRRPRCTI